MIIMFLVIIFPYFLVIMFRTKITDATVITLGISSTAEVVSSIIVLPKIIAKHLFNKKGRIISGKLFPICKHIIMKNKKGCKSNSP